MVSQFISPDDVNLLRDINFDFPEGTHAIGRLDSNSEELLLLTTNKKITRLLFQSKTPHSRTYIVQVIHQTNEESLQMLRDGIPILIKGNVMWTTTPCQVTQIERPSYLHPVDHELPHFVKSSWLQITLTEGKFHQVRKMVYAIRHKCRRLIRISIEDMHLGDLAPGEVKEMSEKEFFRLLKLDD